MHYVVIEKVPDTQASVGYSRLPVPNFKDQLITVVEADTSEEAMQLVMGATRRVGQYAVIECDYFSFAPNKAAEASPDGVLRKSEPTVKPKELASRVDQMAAESDAKLEKLEKELEELRRLGASS